MEIEVILGIIALICFILCFFIFLVARITKIRRDKAERKEAAEKLAHTRANIALQRLKISGIERRTKWIEEDSSLSKDKSGLK